MDGFDRNLRFKPDVRTFALEGKVMHRPAFLYILLRSESTWCFVKSNSTIFLPRIDHV